MPDSSNSMAFASAEEFSAAFSTVFGATPEPERSGDTVMLDWIDTPVGPLVAGANSEALVLLEFTERKILEAQMFTLRRRFAAAIVPGSNERLEQLRVQLAEYFAGRRRDFDVPLQYPGTPFQEKVWTELLRIPYGSTRSYRDLALKLGDANACRAVGTANGMNRIAIVIPCHRVVNANGGLGGYGGGLWRKRVLLDLECGQWELGM